MGTLRTRAGVDLYYSAYGPDSAAVTLLLGHCWTSDQDSWRYQARDLLSAYAGRVRVVTWDHRGHGRSSSVPRSRCTITGLAEDLSDLVDAVAPSGPLVLGGHSIGGMTMMGLAELRPELYDECVVGAAFVSTSAAGMDPRAHRLPPGGRAVVGQVPAALALRSRTLSRRARRRTPTVERQVMSRLVFGSPQRLRDVALAVDGLASTPGASVVGFYEDIRRHERTQALTVLDTIPTRVLVGSRDRLTPPSQARRIAEHVAGAELTVIPGAGHMLPLERDAEVTAALGDLVAPYV